ncbi:hypothetical protein D3C71_1483700 [compost metagenome]
MAKTRAIAFQEAPVETVERTGAIAALGLHVIATSAAIVAHALNIGAGGGIGLGPDDPAVREGGHAPRVRHLHPLIGVGIDRHVPVIDRVRMNAQHHGQIACDHQALDMVGIGVGAGGRHHVGDAGHVRLA